MLKLIENSRWFGICGLVCLLCMAGCAKPEDEDNDSTDVDEESNQQQNNGKGGNTSVSPRKNRSQNTNSQRTIANNKTAKNGGPHKRSQKNRIVKGSCQLKISCEPDGSGNDCIKTYGGLCEFKDESTCTMVAGERPCSHLSGRVDHTNVKITFTDDPAIQSSDFCQKDPAAAGGYTQYYPALFKGIDACADAFSKLPQKTRETCEDKLRVTGVLNNGRNNNGRRGYTNAVRRIAGKPYYAPDGASLTLAMYNNINGAYVMDQQWCEFNEDTEKCKRTALPDPCKGKNKKSCETDKRCKW
ncbi:MAG: hypothetical protein AAF320_03905 [Myxococcota bacterium]